MLECCKFAKCVRNGSECKKQVDLKRKSDKKKRLED